MDAKGSISRSIENLQPFLNEGATTVNPRLKKQVQTAIDNLLATKQLLNDVDVLNGAPLNDQMIAQLLAAVLDSTENAISSLASIQESQLIINGIDDDDRSSNSSLDETRSCGCRGNGLFDLQKFTDVMKYCCRPLLCAHKMKYFYIQSLFTQKMKKLDDKFRRLQEKIMKEAVTSVINNNINNNRKGISDFVLEAETQVVGIQQQMDELVAQLIPQHNYNDGQSSVNAIEALDDQQHCVRSSTRVITVIGEGGSGKTTLVRSVYNRINVKRHFTHRAWVRIPSVFKTKDVLADILEQVDQAQFVIKTTLCEDEAVRRLTKSLKGTRHLIVLEDLNEPPIWACLKRALSAFSSEGGCKIIITTRNLPPDDAHSTLRIRRLNNDESWELFSKKVRTAENELSETELIPIKEQILKLCDGLPLLIVLLGGLLSTKAKSCGERRRIMDMLANKTSEDILALTYQNLPSVVKPCFLYMGLFPQGFEIPVRRLIHLWCAEGFMTSSVRRKKDPMHVAEMCFEKLVTRNMVEVAWKLDGCPKTCWVPSVLYDFFSTKAANVGFLHHHFQSSHKQQKFQVQRLAAYLGINDLTSSFCPVGNLLSYIAIDNRVQITPARDIDMLLNRVTSGRGFGLLKVLDLEDVYKPRLSNNIVRKLLQLSYLGLRSTFMDSLPDATGNLSCLETLDVKHTNIRCITLPTTNKLQHIYLNRNYSQTTVDGALENLRTLWGLNVSLSCDIRAFLQTRRLTKLGLTLKRTNGESQATYIELRGRVARWIKSQTELQSLKLRSIKSDFHKKNRRSIMSVQGSEIGLESMVSHKMLRELYLVGNLRQSVINVSFLPPNLRELTLSLSQLDEDPMPVLGQLSQLNVLKLFSFSYKGEQMTCPTTGFARLRVLKLWKLPVRVWELEKGAMPCLRELEIRSCENLELPQGLQNVITLKELVLTNMTPVFEAAVEESLIGRDVYIRKNIWKSDRY